MSENLQSTGWFEIENSPQSYPRTAVIGYALKAVDEHQNGVPNFTSLVKGLLVKGSFKLQSTYFREWRN